MSAPAESFATATNAVLTCTISEISTAVSVTWKNGDGADLADSTGALAQYTVDEGTYSTTNSNQQSTLTVTPTGMDALSDTTTTFTCVVKSGEYPDDSPEVSAATAALTKLTYGM